MLNVDFRGLTVTLKMYIYIYWIRALEPIAVDAFMYTTYKN